MFWSTNKLSLYNKVTVNSYLCGKRQNINLNFCLLFKSLVYNKH